MLSKTIHVFFKKRKLHKIEGSSMPLKQEASLILTGSHQCLGPCST